MPIRITSEGYATPHQIAAGIRYAADRGARIITVSFAHAGYDDVEAEAVRYAQSKGALITASAGNQGNEERAYPAAYPGVLGVTATDRNDRLTSWATRGSWVTLAAPGEQMV